MPSTPACRCLDLSGKYNAAADAQPGVQVSVLEMDGQFEKLEELIYVESHLSNTSAKFYGEITQQMLKNSSFPGSKNGTGLFQTIVGLKIREVFEQIRDTTVAPGRAALAVIDLCSAAAMHSAVTCRARCIQRHCQRHARCM